MTPNPSSIVIKSIAEKCARDLYDLAESPDDCVNRIQSAINEAQEKLVEKLNLAQAKIAEKDEALKDWIDGKKFIFELKRIAIKALSSTAGSELLNELKGYKETLKIQREEIEELRKDKESLLQSIAAYLANPSAHMEAQLRNRRVMLH